jgi:site-specific DNA recombinase
MNDLDYFKKYIPETKKLDKFNFFVWSYTRVSSKEQFNSNSSVVNQKMANINYAKEFNYEISEEFGGTYESAKSDFTRKEFTRLIDRVEKSKKKPYAILVFKMSRFSRAGASPIGLVNRLVEELGVHLIETSTGLSTTTIRGKIAIIESLLHAYKENVERMEIILPGMKSFVQKGNKFGIAAQGYDHYGPRVKREGFNAIKQRFEINKEGELLKEAWIWKASGLYNDIQIINKLERLGLTLLPQKISKIWRNPFYAGISVNKMLDEPVKGHWEPIVSLENFKKVQAILSNNPTGYQHDIEHEKRLLTHLIKCIHCETGLVGYEVKKKGLHYYRCPKCNGMSVNANTTPRAKQMGANDLYKEFLKSYTLDPELVPVLKFQMEKMYDLHIGQTQTDQERFGAQKRELEGQFKNLKIRRGLGEIDNETFELTSKHISEKLTEIEAKIDDSLPEKSNLVKMIEEGLDKATKLNVIWDCSNLENKKNISRIVFPEAVLYDAKNHRYLTKKVNSFFALINNISMSYEQNKSGNSQNFIENSHLVARPGFEPGTSGL